MRLGGHLSKATTLLALGGCHWFGTGLSTFLWQCLPHPLPLLPHPPSHQPSPHWVCRRASFLGCVWVEDWEREFVHPSLVSQQHGEWQCLRWHGAGGEPVRYLMKSAGVKGNSVSPWYDLGTMNRSCWLGSCLGGTSRSPRVSVCSCARGFMCTDAGCLHVQAGGFSFPLCER